MSNPADANKVNPQNFIITPNATQPAGVTVDDYTIDIGPSDVNNTVPSTFPISVLVPKTDVVVQSDGNVHVPFSDVVKQMLAAGTYCARCESDAGPQESVPGPTTFFNIVPPAPNPPTGFTVA